jgi:hypothetical protein
MRRARVTLTFLAALAAGCAAQTPAPTGSLGIVSPTAPGPLDASPGGASPRFDVAASPYGGGAIPLTEVSGSVPRGGAGILNDIQTGKPGFDNFEVTLNVHGAPPDTDLYFQFSGDVFPGTRGDGVCPPFPAPPGNTLQVLHTSAGGTVSAHVKFPVPEGAFFGGFDSDVQSDFAWRVVNLSQTFDLRTLCIVLTGK